MAQTDAVLGELKRMSRLLALVAVKDISEGAATILLDKAEYGQAEIAKLLDRKPSAVSMTLLRHREGKNAKGPKKAAKGKKVNRGSRR